MKLFHQGLIPKARSLFVFSSSSSPAKKKKEKKKNQQNRVANPPDYLFSLKSPDCESKEDTFFDSKVRFDSDCEDDFFSVNGEFTPSRGSTSVHPIGDKVPAPNAALLLGSSSLKRKSEPAVRRTRFGDLLREDSDGGQADDEREADGQGSSSEADDTEMHDISGETTPRRQSKHGRERCTRCCFPITIAKPQLQ